SPVPLSPRSPPFPYTTLFRSRFKDPADVIARVPVTSEGTDEVPENSSVRNFDVWFFDGTVTVVDAAVDPSLFFSVIVTFALALLDRKSTRLNSSHRTISYAVF